MSKFDTKVNYFSIDRTKEDKLRYTAELTEVTKEALCWMFDHYQLKTFNVKLEHNGLYTVSLEINSSGFIIENLLRSLLND